MDRIDLEASEKENPYYGSTINTVEIRTDLVNKTQVTVNVTKWKLILQQNWLLILQHLYLMTRLMLYEDKINADL